MGSTISILNSLPPLQDLLHPTPETFTQILSIWQYFAPFTIFIWLTTWFPMGKTSLKSSIFNIPGHLAWSAMELMAPLNLIHVMQALAPKLNTDLRSLPLANQVVAALYLIHYANRAVISPLFAAPSMSPIHASIAVSGLTFNWFTSTCLAAWLLGYHIPVTGYRTDGFGDTSSTRPVISEYLPYLGIVLFFLGMAGNIISERTFFRLRREEADKLHAQKDNHAKDAANKYSKVYVIPPAKGLFRFILYPHYVFEWLEWTGFVLVGTAVYPASGAVAPEMSLAPWLTPAAALAQRLRVPLPLAAVVFVVNVVTSMVPQARLGMKWYLSRFGKDKIAGRGAVVPFSGWL
ncbi:3-oxo-5-alpha-steroid 4-dehydrogenase family protein [Aspergillus nomiae NRRL 13137]|uniref:3-oxo-5-alpha-steroid 4-dehydrogenase family protein n=1 Tax=Aspergillus nomiae NRRL (strain ATCC 15546 / NRRL 13137 / CBS 260.88 / M93) TaxID=1509407 RepID=A0A0L1ITI9_ASPN3|nr:3-oxo-5-alpha-steroid 4-dehydrogenase family protein [Aspergillus nomiae NRRL 13137]KNG82817.1 3-oxo-5-alpha-steroid 4-dehydrogenase family protein [Aspergillus nomiae NRRL 13137]